MARFAETKDITVGVVGYGGQFNMGLQHLNGMKNAGMTPIAVAELDEERLKVAAQDFPGIETYTSVAEMLEKSAVNLVTIITPHNTHAALTLQCLKAGRHVVCEKPLAVTTDECDAMIKEAQRQDLVLSTYHNRHWDGNILRAVEQVVQQGVIGDVVRIEAHMGGYGKPRDWWRSSKSISGGVLYDWGVHLLEYSLQLLPGAGITEVSGFHKTGVWAPHTGWKDDTNEDEAQAVVRFDSGQWLTLTVTSLDSNPKDGMLEITGTKGTYVMEGRGWTLITHEDAAKVVRTGQNPPSQGQCYYDNVAAYLTGTADLVITAEWSRRPIHILDLADRSAKQNRSLAATYA